MTTPTPAERIRLRDATYSVSLRPDPLWPHRIKGPVLYLRNAPQFLRFVVRGINWDSLDALDHHHDVAEDDERIIPAISTGIAYGFMSGHTKGGKPWGSCFRQVGYIAISEKVPDKILRDNLEWNLWVAKQKRRDAWESK